MLNNIVYQHGDSVFLSDIGPQPVNRSDAGATLVCITTNVNIACCRADDNNGMTNNTAGAVGEWHYPNGNLVPYSNSELVDLAKVGFTHEIRLTREVSYSTPPLGMYTCEVPGIISGVLHRASIIIQLGKHNLDYRRKK